MTKAYYTLYKKCCCLEEGLYYQAAADVHQARLSRSVRVGWM